MSRKCASCEEEFNEQGEEGKQSGIKVLDYETGIEVYVCDMFCLFTYSLMSWDEIKEKIRGEFGNVGTNVR